MPNHHASYEVLREKPRPPQPAPRECALCGAAGPAWWWFVDSGRSTTPYVVAPWWPACDGCDRQMAESPSDVLRALIEADGPWPELHGLWPELLRNVTRWGPVTQR